MTRSLTLAILALSAACLISGAARAASFDCDAKELKPDEKVICDNRALNDADVKMTTTFDLLSGLLAMGSRGTLQDEQTAWLKKRQECGADAACIKAAYDERMKQLGETYKNINRPL
ncbi:lysozyme inhibitor LprI family protein [Rhizobium mongolense]|uniref:lysozyme inhibitor LprI family protein n=1 Tax=Rhizobium mongolense TaxID=57676 RepID=UPI0034A47637